MLKKRFRKLDVLERKKDVLNTYVKQYDMAVSMVTGIVDALSEANTGIEQTITEIDAYQKELEVTAEGLRTAKERNTKVIGNFKALLAID